MFSHSPPRYSESELLASTDKSVENFLRSQVGSQGPVSKSVDSDGWRTYKLKDRSICINTDIYSDRDDFHLDISLHVKYADYFANMEWYKKFSEACSYLLDGPTLDDLITINKDIIKNSVDYHEVYKRVIKEHPELSGLKHRSNVIVFFGASTSSSENKIVISAIATMIETRVNREIHKQLLHVEEGGLRLNNNCIDTTSSLVLYYDRECVIKAAAGVQIASVELEKLIKSGEFARQLIERLRSDKFIDFNSGQNTNTPRI